jgi:hypothetical protein
MTARVGIKQRGDTAMQITVTIDVDESLIRAAALQEFRAAFQPTDQRFGTNGGRGTAAIREQLERWAKQRDWTAQIEELGSLMRPTVRAALEATIKREMRAIKESGVLAMMVRESMEASDES